MTVRITKPAFNLREKISELDYSILPYDKIPPGSIVQSKVKYSNNTVFSTSADAWTTLQVTNQVDFTMKFTPRFLGSKVVFETDLTTKLDSENGYVRYRLADLNDPRGNNSIS